MRAEILDHLDKALSEATRYNEPFALFSFKPFPDDIYQEVLKQFPDDRFFIPNEHRDCLVNGVATRRSLTLRPDRLKPLPPLQRSFWYEMNSVLRSAQCAATFCKYLGVTEPVLPFAALLRDTKGYKITVHPDWDVKRITAQFYLPADDSMAPHGTEIYDHQKQYVRTLPFLPNTGYVFKRTETSYHAVTELPDIKRNSLYITFNRKPWDEY
jgi:hypothetical protein